MRSAVVVVVAMSAFVDCATAQSPRTLIITMDDVGREYYPTFDGLGALEFPAFYTHPICQPSRAALMTGRRPWRTGVGGNSNRGLPFEETTMMEVLPDATDILIGKWHLGHRVSRSPLVQGVDIFSGTLSNIFLFQDYWNYDKRLQVPWWEISNPPTDYSTAEITNEAITAITTLEGEWLIQVHYHAAHSPWAPPPSYEDGDDETDYQNMIEFMANEIERLLSHVDLSDTLVFILSDNGAPLGDDVSRGKGSVYEPGINTPLLVTGAFAGQKLDSGARSDLVAIEDIFATVLEHHGCMSSAEDSISLGPTLSKGKAHPRTEVLVEIWTPDYPPYDKSLRAAITTKFRDVFKLHRNCVTGNEKLYNLTQDPGETSPLYLGGPAYDFLAAYMDENGGCR